MQPHEVVIPIFVMFAIAAMVISGIVTKHRERMTMVEKGMTSEDIKAIYTRTIQRNPLNTLKWGILFVFIGISILLGNVLHSQFNIQSEIMLGLIPLFAGCALVLFYTIATKKANQ